VALQAILLVALLAAAAAGPRWPSSMRVPLAIVGIALAAGGLALAGAAVLLLGRTLSALPWPREGTTVRTDGVFRLVRHPIYGGLILLAGGGSLATSPLALAPACTLAVVLEGKRRVEERWLLDADPSYAAYRDRVRHAFVPEIW
jgi:protein-S-isoprenylcysteine O-methyltransferase Ste14